MDLKKKAAFVQCVEMEQKMELHLGRHLACMHFEEGF